MITLLFLENIEVICKFIWLLVEFHVRWLSMKCKRCGEDDDELELMVATIHEEPRYLCQKCGEMNWKIQLYVVDPTIAIFECLYTKDKTIRIYARSTDGGASFWCSYTLGHIQHIIYISYIPMMPRLEYWYYKFTSKRFTCNDYILSRIYFKVENSEPTNH